MKLFLSITTYLKITSNISVFPTLLSFLDIPALSVALRRDLIHPAHSLASGRLSSQYRESDTLTQISLNLIECIAGEKDRASDF